MALKYSHIFGKDSLNISSQLTFKIVWTLFFLFNCPLFLLRRWKTLDNPKHFICFLDCHAQISLCYQYRSPAVLRSDAVSRITLSHVYTSNIWRSWRTYEITVNSHIKVCYCCSQINLHNKQLYVFITVMKGKITQIISGTSPNCFQDLPSSFILKGCAIRIRKVTYLLNSVHVL